MDSAVRNLDLESQRTCFFWPMTLCLNGSGSGETTYQDAVHKQFETLSGLPGPWQGVTDSLRHLRSQGSARQFTEADIKATYGEFIYFHDFVQRAIFGSSSTLDGRHPMTLLERTDVTELACTFGSETGDWMVSYHVERLNLYLLAPGIAVLALQVAAKPQPGPALTLEAAMQFNDRFRRSHVPYFHDDGGAGGDLPHTVVWTTTSGEKHAFLLSDSHIAPDPTWKTFSQTSPTQTIPTQIAQDMFNAKAGDRQVAPLPHWQWLLNGPQAKDGAAPMPLGPVSGRDWYWRHFSDDRLPVLSTIILPDRAAYYALQDGDWMRLAFIDGPGEDDFPYAAKFQQDTFAQHCYDRYHHIQTAGADAPTRYMMCDYAMTAVTYANESRDKRYSYATTLSAHMQRHYYQMFLLAIIDKATMLGLSSRISQAIEDYDIARSNLHDSPDRESVLSETMQDIERDFLHYVHRFRFTGISGQLQASEMFAQLRRVMQLDELFEDIKTELETAVNFLSSREAQHATNAAERLNIIASLGVVLALAMAFLSMNLLTTEQALFGKDDAVGFRPIGYHAVVFLFVLGVASLGALSLQHFASSRLGLQRRSPRPSERLVKDLLLWLGFGSIMAFLVVLAFL